MIAASSIIRTSETRINAEKFTQKVRELRERERIEHWTWLLLYWKFGTKINMLPKYMHKPITLFDYEKLINWLQKCPNICLLF